MIKILVLSIFVFFSCSESNSSKTDLKKSSDTKHNEVFVEENCYCNGIGTDGGGSGGGYSGNVPVELEGIVADIAIDKSLIISDPALIEEFDPKKRLDETSPNKIWVGGHLRFGRVLASLHLKVNLPDDDPNVQNLFETYLKGFEGVHGQTLLSNELDDIRPKTITPPFGSAPGTPPTKISDAIRNEWEKDSSGNLTQRGAPYRLMAIMIRPELFETDATGKVISAGQIRLLYKFVDKDKNLDTQTRRSYTILEYGMPVDTEAFHVAGNASSISSLGSWSREQWVKTVGKLSCYKQDTSLSKHSYRSTLLGLLRRSTRAKYEESEQWKGGAALKNVRVNDFLAPPWSLFSYVVTNDGFLKRHRLEKTPKDNFSNVSNGIIKNGIVPGDKNLIKNYIQGNFETIASLVGEDYELPSELRAWQNDFGFGASWVDELIPLGIIRPDIQPSGARKAHHTAMIRNFSINTCVSCHKAHFSDQHSISPPVFETLPSAAAILGIPEFKFQGLGQETSFIHVDKGSSDISMSKFLEQDQIFREQELEFQLSTLTCNELPPTTHDLEIKVYGDKVQAPVGEHISFFVEVLNKGPAISTNTFVNANCPEKTAFSIVEPIEKVAITQGGAFGSSTFRTGLDSLLPGVRAKFRVSCKIISGDIGDKLVFDVFKEDIETELVDPVLSNNSGSFTTIIGNSVVLVKKSDLAVLVESDLEEVELDEDIKFTVKFKNLGPDSGNFASYKLLQERCPAETEYISHSVSKGSVVAGNGAWADHDIWSFSLGVNEEARLEIVCKNKNPNIDEMIFYEVSETDYLKTLIEPDTAEASSNNSAIVSVKVTKKQDLVNCDYDYNDSDTLSTIDLVLSQKTLLQINPKIEGKEYDVNGDGKHSALDLIQFRKCILGVLTKEQAFTNPNCETIEPAPPCN